MKPEELQTISDYWKNEDYIEDKGDRAYYLDDYIDYQLEKDPTLSRAFDLAKSDIGVLVFELRKLIAPEQLLGGPKLVAYKKELDKWY